MKELTMVRDAMPEHSKRALDYVVRRSPGWQGANWDDVLDRLLDTDANLDITEPMWEALSPEFTPEHQRLILPVTFTLWYANGEKVPVSTQAVRTWVTLVVNKSHGD